MKQTIRIIIISALAMAAAAIKAVPALAEPAGPTSVSIVHTADLDLSSAAGQRELDHRLVRASVEVCGEASNVDLSGSNAVRSCRNAVLAEAHAKAAVLAANRAASRDILIAAR